MSRNRDTIELVAPEQPDFCRTFQEVGEDADQVAQGLRRIAANAVAANPECRPDLEYAVKWLETVAGFMTTNGVVNRGAYGQKSYQVEHLMQCFLICMNLKDDRRLSTILERSIKAICPAHVANSILYNMRRGWDCPRQSTISRFRLSMDTGYMEIMRQEHTRYTFDASSGTVLDGPAIYSSLDSSLQGNVDWEVMYYTLIEESDLIPLSKCVNRLIHLRTEPETEARDQEIRSINLFITNAVKIHIMPPGALGSKRLGLIHKLLKYCHSARLEHHTLASLQVCTGRTFPFLRSC